MDEHLPDDPRVSTSTASDMDYSNKCEPCDQDLLNREAVCYCEVCEKKFCQSCSTMHTKILREHGTVPLAEDNDAVDEGPSDQLESSIGAIQGPIFQGHRTCNVKLPDDKKQCHVTSCCYLQDGTTLIVDNTNQTLKLLSEDKSVMNSMVLPDHPNVACVVDEHTVAVTMADNAVLLVYVNRHEMKITSADPMEHECHCIAHHNGTLYIGDAQKIYRYSMECEPLGLFYSNMSAPKSVKYFVFSNDSEKMYVTNEVKGELVILDNNGKTLSTINHPNLQAPRGVCIGEDESVYVCGYQSSTIIKTDATGRDPVRVLRKNDGIVSPISVCYDCARGELLIGQWQSDFMVVFEKTET